MERHRCRHWTAAIAVAIVGPLLGCNMYYSQWFDEWGLWDPYSTIMSEIDGDPDNLLTIFHLLFGENCRLKKNKVSTYTGGLEAAC